MANLYSYAKTITTDAGGDAEVYFGSSIAGRVIAIKYEPGTLDTGADLTITGETSEVPILTAANAGVSDVWYYPKAVVSEVPDATAATDSFADVYVFGERIKLVVAQGGNAASGTMTVFTEECGKYYAN